MFWKSRNCEAVEIVLIVSISKRRNYKCVEIALLFFRSRASRAVEIIKCRNCVNIFPLCGSHYISSKLQHIFSKTRCARPLKLYSVEITRHVPVWKSRNCWSVEIALNHWDTRCRNCCSVEIVNILVYVKSRNCKTVEIAAYFFWGALRAPVEITIRRNYNNHVNLWM